MNKKNQKSENRYSEGYLKYQIMLFLIWPFLSLVVAIRNIRQPGSRHIVTLFCGFIGMMFIVRPGQDASRYRDWFLEYTYKDFSDLWATFTGVFIEQTEADLFQDLIFYLLSRFTSDPMWLWVILGLIIGYIYSKNIWLLLNITNKNFNLNAAVFMLAMLVIINPIQGINQFRFWLAALLFFYGAMHVVLFKDPKYFIVTFLAPLIHFGMLVPNAALLVFYVFGRKDIIYIPLAIGSAFLAEIEFSLLSDYAEFLGPAFEHKLEGYTREQSFDRLEDRQQRAWYVAMWQPMLLYMTYGMMGYTYVAFRDKFSEGLKNMTSFLLIFITLINLISHFPMIYRYMPVLFLFVFTYLYLVYKQLDLRRIDITVIFCVAPILLMVLVQARLSIDLVSAVIFISNPVLSLLGLFETTLFELIR